MRENLTSGLMGGSWKRGSPAGHLRVPGRCAEKRHHDGLVGTQPADHLQPRQLPTRHGRFYRSEMYPLLRRVNAYLRRWAGRKYRQLRPYRRFWRWWTGLQHRVPDYFAQWRWVRDWAL
jgi:hypothetical protein